MELLVEVLKACRISSPIFLIGFVLFCLVLMSIERVSRAGRRLLVAGVLLVAGLATPLGSGWLTAPLRGYAAIERKEQAGDADVIVMLGGGIRSHRAKGLAIDDLHNSALRVIETARLYKLLGPRTVIVSGGNTGNLQPPRSEADAFKAALIDLGVPADRIVLEDRSRNTHEEAVILRPVLEALGARRFILVTSPMHMSRSMRVFRSQQLDPIPSPSLILSDTETMQWLVPDADALLLADYAVYEYAALAYYRIRGWL